MISALSNRLPDAVASARQHSSLQADGVRDAFAFVDSYLNSGSLGTTATHTRYADDPEGFNEEIAGLKRGAIFKDYDAPPEDLEPEAGVARSNWDGVNVWNFGAGDEASNWRTTIIPHRLAAKDDPNVPQPTENLHAIFLNSVSEQKIEFVEIEFGPNGLAAVRVDHLDETNLEQSFRETIVLGEKWTLPQHSG